MKKIFILIPALVVVLSGCWWPWTGARATGGAAASLGSARGTDGKVAVSDGVRVDVLDPVPLKAGGKVFFMPLSAGNDAEAGGQLDHFSLMMVKGFADALAEGGGFVLVSGDDAPQADIVIKGHIEKLAFAGSFHRMASVTVRADVRFARSGEVCALIDVGRKMDADKKSLDLAAYNMGFAIAKKMSQ